MAQENCFICGAFIKDVEPLDIKNLIAPPGICKACEKREAETQRARVIFNAEDGSFSPAPSP